MEVLFAVMILGIGMIMVAAMFPAALKQTQANVEDAASGTVAAAGYNTMQLYANSKDQPLATPSVDTLDRLLDSHNDNSIISYPIVYSFHDQRTGVPAANMAELWARISPNLVSPTDPQYAWVPLWSRSKINVVAGAPKRPNPNTATLEQSFRLFIIPVRCRNRSSGYVGTPQPNENIVISPPTTPSPLNSDIYVDASNDPANLDPALINVTLIVPVSTTGIAPYLQVCGVYYGAGWVPCQSYADANVVGGQPILDANPQSNPVATGTYIVVSDCTNAAYNGTVFKVASQVQSNGLGTGTTGEYWSLATDPATSTGSGMTSTTIVQAKALVVGRGPDTSSSAFQTWALTPPASMQAGPMPRAGPAQDMGISSSIIALP